VDSEFVMVTAAERPDLGAEMLALGDSPWPEYLNHDAVTNALWPLLHELAPDYQFALLTARSDDIVAIGNCLPIRWDGDPGTLPDRGIDAVLEDGIDLLRTGAAPTAASALMVVVQKHWLGKGISARALQAMAEVVGRHRLGDLVAPVRPTDKQKYPLIEMTDYITWRRPDGLSFDPWIRVHERIGGAIARAAPAAMRVTGTVAQWEDWTGMALPATGTYVVPGGLVPVRIDRERDAGEYVEPACWVHHRVPRT
jgi:GNAT superfamily N-acetyltransferase